MRNNMFKKKKGEYGYIAKSKRIDVIKMLLYVGVALAVFGLGLILNKMSYENIFTVLAILFVLPWARVLVEFIVFFPYSTPSKEQYDKVASAIGEDAVLASDMVITSTEKSMGLSFLVMGNGYVVGLVMNQKQNVDEIQNYLRKGVNNWSDKYCVKMYSNFNEFLKDVKEAKEKEITEKERENVEKFIFSLVV